MLGNKWNWTAVGGLGRIVLFGCSFTLVLLSPNFYSLKHRAVLFASQALQLYCKNKKRNNSRGIVTARIEERQKGLVWISSQETENTVL